MGMLHVFAESGEETKVSVMLDEEESFMHFVKSKENEDPCELSDIHAYVVIYSVTDFSSFRKACHMLDHLKKTLTRNAAIILVGNKNDMVRNRIITEAGNVMQASNILLYTKIAAVGNYHDYFTWLG